MRELLKMVFPLAVCRVFIATVWVGAERGRSLSGFTMFTVQHARWHTFV